MSGQEQAPVCVRHEVCLLSKWGDTREPTAGSVSKPSFQDILRVSLL